VRVNGPKWLETLFVLMTAAALLILGVGVLAFGILSAADGKGHSRTLTEHDHD
jgi:hypothetical protein